jgi:hypothetical protein
MNEKEKYQKYDIEIIEDKIYRVFAGEKLMRVGILQKYVDVKFSRGVIMKIAEEYNLFIECDRNEVIYLIGDYDTKKIFEEYIEDVVYKKLLQKEYVNVNDCVILFSTDISDEVFEAYRLKAQIKKLKSELEIEVKEKEILEQEKENLKQEKLKKEKEIEELKNEIEKMKEEKENLIEKIEKYCKKLKG